MLSRVIARLRPQCETLLLSANGEPARFSAFGLPVLADPIDGFPGPLAGVLAALDWTAANRPQCEHVVSVAADCPFLPRDLVDRLQQARISQDARLAVAASGGRCHHVIALWDVTLRDDLRHALVSEKLRKVAAFASRHTSATVEWPIAPLDPFFNANTLDDLLRAERLAALDARG